MSLMIKNHFQAIKLEYFRPKSLRKGIRLMKSLHVSGVIEERRENGIFIRGTVLRENPGAISTRRNENVYSPIIEVLTWFC